MIFNVVKQPVRPKYADDWPDLVHDYTMASRAEPGCIFFEWYRSVEDPNVYVLVEAFRARGCRRGTRRVGALQDRDRAAAEVACRRPGDRARRGAG